MTNLEFVESATEGLLGVLRRRDDDALHQLTSKIAELSREKRRELTASQADVKSTSYQLGAIEALESLAVRACARAPMNARFEVMRRRHALEILQALALAPKQVSTPTQLAQALRQHRSNISRLIEAMIRVGVVKPAQILPQVKFIGDGRSSPLQITPVGIEMLEGLKPDWRTDRPVLDKVPVHHRSTRAVADVQGSIQYGARMTTRAMRNFRPVGVRVFKLEDFMGHSLMDTKDHGALMAHVVNVGSASPSAEAATKVSVATSLFERAFSGTSTFVANKAGR